MNDLARAWRCWTEQKHAADLVSNSEQVFFVLIRAEVDLKRQVDALRVNTMIFTALQSYEVGFSSNSLNFQIQFYFRFVKRPGEPSGVGRKKKQSYEVGFHLLPLPKTGMKSDAASSASFSILDSMLHINELFN